MTSIYTAAIAGFFFPLQERLKDHNTVSVKQALERTQWLGAAELRDLQLQRLNDLLRQAADKVPYYRDLLAKVGVIPGEFTDLNDLQRIPFLTKKEIRVHTEAMKSTSARGLARFNTGGSTGEPLIFFIGKERVSHDVAAKWRATRWWGVDIGDPEIVVWGSPIELGAQDRVRWLRDTLLRTELLPAFEMSDAKLDDFIAAIRRRRPRMLFGYPSALSHIARHARKRGVVMDDLGIKVAFVTSERLYDEQRAIISSVFACPVANGYGGRDAGFIAHECPSGSMHVTAEDIIVEIVNEAGEVQPAGVAGEIVVTHLFTSDFPFVRYRTGDIGVLGTGACACGRGLPLLQEIQGRSTDFVVASDGTVLHGLSLIYILRDLTGVQSFKVIQETRLLTRVQLVTDEQFATGAIDVIRAGFKRRLGQDVEVCVDIVDRIAAEKSGKFRYIVSHAVST